MKTEGNEDDFSVDSQNDTKETSHREKRPTKIPKKRQKLKNY